MRIVIYALVLILIALQFRLWSGEGSYAHVAELNERIAAQEQENEELEARNETLYGEVDALKSTNEAVEERARYELGMIREGETFYMIVDQQKNR